MSGSRLADSRGRARIAVALAGLTAGCLLVALVLIALAPAARVAEIASLRIGEASLFGVTWVTFAIVGAIIVRYQPDNMVGWLCSLAGLYVAVIAVATGIATYSLALDGTSPIGVTFAWIVHTGSVSTILVPLLILMRFPTGRPLSRPAEWLTIAAIGLFVPLLALEPMRLITFPTTPNPLGLGEARIEFLIILAYALLGVPIASVTGTLILRYRRGSAVERLQLRWLGLATILLVCAAISAPLTSPGLVGGGRLSTTSVVINAVAFTSIPVAIGIAIVRYRLYDIDVIVKRTVVYGVVSAVLAAVYVVGVLVLQGPLVRIVPGEAQTLATAGSTLLVAALFRPIRARVQRTIDRRFDRERYEARRTIESFAADVRGEVELDAILRDFRAATARTVHPATAACWIRGRIA